MKFKHGKPRERDFFQRSASKILLAFILATPAMIYFAALAVGTNSNRLDDWLPTSLDETVALKKFNEWFGEGQFVIISWDGCRVDTTSDPADGSNDDPRLGQLAALLIPPPDASMELAAPSNFEPIEEAPVPVVEGLSIEGRRRFFKRVVTSRTLLQTLTDAPLSIPHREAIERLTGSVLGKNGEACCIVFLHEAATDELRQAIGFRKPRWIDRAASQGLLYRSLIACDIPLDQAYLGGPPIDNLSINEEGQRTLLRLGLAAAGLGLLLAWWSLRSISLTIIVFSCGIVSTCGATAAIWLTGCHADAIVLAMPSLIYVLTISGAIHLVNYYRDAVEQHGTAGAASRAILAGYKPATLCSVTTALGLLSLFASDLTPIRRFGIFSALGMLLMLAVLFLLLPSALEFFGKRRGFGFRIRDPRAMNVAETNGWIELLSVQWARWTVGHYRRICWAGLLVMVLLSGGISQMRTSVDLLKLFDSKTRILSDYQWIEAHIGNLVPLEILIRFNNDSITNSIATTKGKLTTLDRAQIVNHIRGKVEATFGQDGTQLISPPMSAVAFMPNLPTRHRGTAAIVRNRITNQKLNESRESLLASGYLTVDPGSGDELWRISLRVAAFKQVDYGLFAEDVKAVVDPLVAEVNGKVAVPANNAGPTVQAIHTGAIPIVYKAQRELLTSLIESTAWSFVTITPLMMWVTRGVLAGLVAMLPNLLPVLAVFGSMGWMGIPVDIGCMMTASIALGVAVDDTIHFLCWYRHGQETTSSRGEAIESAFRNCGRPTLQAAVINGLGLSVFLLSTFVPTKQFGLLMLVILTCGAVAELVLLPAILASPLGRVFDASPPPRPDDNRHSVVIQPPRASRVTKHRKATSGSSGS